MFVHAHHPLERCKHRLISCKASRIESSREFGASHHLNSVTFDRRFSFSPE